MSFDEIQTIWDAESQRDLFAVDEAALHRMVRRQGRTVARYVGVFEVMMILITLTMAMVLGGEPIVYGHDHHQFVDAAIWLVITTYLLIGRVRRRRRDHGFDDSVRGDLDKAIAQIDYQIRRLRSFLWWFIVPIGIGAATSLAVLHDSKPLWVWPLVVAALLTAWWSMRRDLIQHQLPKKRELEALREIISSAE